MQAVLETELPQVNMFGFVSHNFKRPPSVQNKDLWLLLGPRLEGSSPVCQWAGICLVERTSLIVARLACGFLVCWQMQWAVVNMVLWAAVVTVLWWLRNFQIMHSTTHNHLWLSGLQSCEVWMKFWIVSNPLDKALWSCSHYFFSCLSGFWDLLSLTHYV